MSLIDQILVAAVWTNSGLSFANTNGAPIASAVENGSGEGIADVYTLTLSAVVGATGTVTVTTAAPRNPYNGRVVAGVNLDGVTAYDNIVPGANIVFAVGGANANAGNVDMGQYDGTFDSFGAGAGTPSADVRHRVLNDGAGAVGNAKAQLVTAAIHVRKTGLALAYVKPFAASAVEKTAGGGSDQIVPYKLKIVNVAGAGPAKTCDLQLDGVTFAAATLLDMMTGAVVSGVGLKAVTPNNPYQVLSGPLQDLIFAVHPGCVNNDVANILIFPPRYQQIAPDVGGAPGTWGIADVDLTQVGQGAGIIQSLGVAFYHKRILVPAGASSGSNPYIAKVALTATESQGADWLG